jgi:hypothetical protein
MAIYLAELGITAIRYFVIVALAVFQKIFV